MSETSCPVVDCFQPACRSKCGGISNFINLSNCHVQLEYRLANEQLWHSLGAYAPGVRTELGGGTILLPEDADIRAVHQKPHSQEKQVIANWGRLTFPGLPTLFVDSSMCQREADTFASFDVTEEASLQASVRPPVRPPVLGPSTDSPATRSSHPLWWVWPLLLMGGVFLLIWWPKISKGS